MKSGIKIILFVLLFTFVYNTNLFAQKTTTVIGEIVELKTFVVDKIKPTSTAGLEVTKENLKQGGTFALLENKTNKIVILIPSNTNKNLFEALDPYLGMKVFVKGQQYSSGGLRILTVDDIGKSLK